MIPEIYNPSTIEGTTRNVRLPNGSAEKFTYFCGGDQNHDGNSIMSVVSQKIGTDVKINSIILLTIKATLLCRTEANNPRGREMTWEKMNESSSSVNVTGSL